MSFLTKEITLPKLGKRKGKAAGKAPAVSAPAPATPQPAAAPESEGPTEALRPASAGRRRSLTVKRPARRRPSVDAGARRSRRALSVSPGRRRSASVTGLEISATQLIAAEGRLQDGRIVAERVATRDLPPGLLREGLVVDVERLASELKAFFGESRLSKRVRVGLATPRTVLRVIDLPPLDEKDVRAALMMQAQDRIPMPLDRAVMDFQTVGLVDTPDGQRMRVIVVVTERAGIEPLLEALRRAGLRAEGIDLSIFAVMRALAGRQAEEPVLYADLGDIISVGIAEHGICRFTRQAPQGLGSLLERLAEKRAIPIGEALAALRAFTPPAPAEAAAFPLTIEETLGGAAPVAQQDPQAELDQEIVQLLDRAAADLGAELRAASEFYATQFGTPVISGAVVGPLATLPGFVQSLSAFSGLRLICGEATPARVDALNGVDPRLAAVASGLSISEVGA